MSLFWRIFLTNAAILIAAIVALALGPVTVSTPIARKEAVILGAGLVVMLVVNAVILRLTLRPLQRLARTMTTTDLLKPTQRPTVAGSGEIADLIVAHNSMLDRLEAERAASSGRALSAQEAERQRVAQELHDEVGQSLTAVLLELKRVADIVPEPVRGVVHEVQETTRSTLDEVRRIARRLRPGVLEELGLVSALKALTAEFTTGDLTVDGRFDHQLPSLDRESELVLYRVAQEGLTNIARHARARHATVELYRARSGIDLTVIDDGKGLGRSTEGAGIRGMRERALLVGAHLVLKAGAHGGTELRLRIPAVRRKPSVPRAADHAR
ncbi:HAMP domain-containing sensor histidine kinase [Tenggerimyces flavus]|uniref:histidine kinase n=1 Tax=Tenggerimyces flavus TaxID=1708749 RepID=A0ABV7YJG0_9ACTN|nr:HAMP domain-containing sensor histidine kinase [Tenggerimyces flavus]MBM7789676.1 two-component system sensor histidine kinase UhpB [Tenggerimyces flavus]